MAVANYHDVHGSLPPAYITDQHGRPMHSWRVLILPFLEQQALYERYDFNEPWDGPNNRRLLAERPDIYRFHDADDEAPFTNYVAVTGRATAWPGPMPLTTKQIGDGLENTILVIENRGAGIAWTEPRDIEFKQFNADVDARSPNGVSSIYRPPAVVTIAGSVHTLPRGLTRRQMRALLTANGGEGTELDGNVKEIPDGRFRPTNP